MRMIALMALVAGVVCKPLLEHAGGMHASEHAVLAAADVGHDHDHSDHDPAKNPDHAKGFHGLMHQAECGTAAALLPTCGFALHTPPTAILPLSNEAAPSSRVPASPFRPPIA